MDHRSDNKEQLKEIIHRLLNVAEAKGATSAEADIGTGHGLSVTARMGELETIEHQRDKGISITVYIGNRKGNANSTDFSDNAIESSVEAACTIAKNTSEDHYAGLLEEEHLATDIPDLDLFHPWALSTDQARDITIECENLARGYDDRITNSDGCTLNTYSGTHVYGNSHGFTEGWHWSSHSLDCAVIADEHGKMQRDGWYTRARHGSDLMAISHLAEETARRACLKLGARKLSTQSVPVIFEAPVASSLFASFISAISGGNLYRKSTFLLDKLGHDVFPQWLCLAESPHIPRGMGSAPFDNDGMATKNSTIVKNGVLESYVLSAYSARKLGMQPTGNAGGVHNLKVNGNEGTLNDLIKKMDTGLLITEMIGFGINMVTGDYSRGASGLWIENGEVQFPVEEITVAGNLADMFKHIIAVADDVDYRNNIQTGSVLIESMTVAGD